jgi:hypothetical protein
MVRIKLYDILGKEIATIVNNFRTAGSYKVELNADNLICQREFIITK